MTQITGDYIIYPRHIYVFVRGYLFYLAFILANYSGLSSVTIYQVSSWGLQKQPLYISRPIVQMIKANTLTIFVVISKDYSQSYQLSFPARDMTIPSSHTKLFEKILTMHRVNEHVLTITVFKSQLNLAPPMMKHMIRKKRYEFYFT